MTEITTESEFLAASQRIEELNRLIGVQALGIANGHLFMEREDLYQATKAYNRKVAEIGRGPQPESSTPMLDRLVNASVFVVEMQDNDSVAIRNAGEYAWSEAFTRDELLALAEEIRGLAEGMKTTEEEL
jgi:hypothetical protein